MLGQALGHQNKTASLPAYQGNPLLTVSLVTSCSSLIMKIMSNRDRMVGMKSMFWGQEEPGGGGGDEEGMRRVSSAVAYRLSLGLIPTTIH